MVHKRRSKLMTEVEHTNFRLDLGDERLWNGEGPVQLTNKTFQLLRFFVENPGRLLAKNEILESIWPDLYVTEGLIKEYVHKLRVALHDDRKKPRYIETVHGRGYRYLGGIEVINTGTGQFSQASVPASSPTVAILPFDNTCRDPEQEYLANGITEDIRTALSRFRSLRVIAPNSSIFYRGQSVNARAIGRQLGVHYLVVGSVRKLNERARFTAQLLDAETGDHLWAERYDRELDDIFAVQDEVTEAIAGALPSRLGEAAVRRARRKPTEGLTAYDCLLRGEWYLQGDNSDPDAREMFKKAIEIDPQCTRAYARLAVYYALFSRGKRTKHDETKARSFAENALAIDDGDPLALCLAAVAYLLVGEHDLARHHMQAAITLNPNDIHVIYYAAQNLIYLGCHAEAQQWIRKAIRLDPHVWDLYRDILFSVFYMTRQYEQAIKYITEWRNPCALYYADLAAACAQLGRMDEARAAVSKFNKLLPEGYDFATVAAAHARICKHKEDAEHWLEGYRKTGLL